MQSILCNTFPTWHTAVSHIGCTGLSGLACGLNDKKTQPMKQVKHHSCIEIHHWIIHVKIQSFFYDTLPPCFLNWKSCYTWHLYMFEEIGFNVVSNTRYSLENLQRCCRANSCCVVRGNEGTFKAMIRAGKDWCDLPLEVLTFFRRIPRSGAHFVVTTAISQFQVFFYSCHPLWNSQMDI